MASVKLIQYDEDQWYRYSPEEQQQVKDTWVKKWLPVTEFHRIVLKLVPDPIFPRSEKELPYVEWQYDLEADRKPPELFKISAMVQVIIPKESFDVSLRRVVELELLKYPNGTQFEVLNSLNNTIHSGKVLK